MSFLRQLFRKSSTQYSEQHHFTISDRKINNSYGNPIIDLQQDLYIVLSPNNPQYYKNIIRGSVDNVDNSSFDVVDTDTSKKETNQKITKITNKFMKEKNIQEIIVFDNEDNQYKFTPSSSKLTTSSESESSPSSESESSPSSESESSPSSEPESSPSSEPKFSVFKNIIKNNSGLSFELQINDKLTMFYNDNHELNTIIINQQYLNNITTEDVNRIRVEREFTKGNKKYIEYYELKSDTEKLIEHTFEIKDTNKNLNGGRKITRRCKRRATSIKTKHIRSKLLGGHVPNDINAIVYDAKNREKFISNLGRPLKTGFFSSKTPQGITPIQMNKDIENLKAHMRDMDDDPKYKLCSELVLSLFDSLEIVTLPPSSPKSHEYNGWGSDELKSSHEYIDFVTNYCLTVIKKYQELQKEKQELHKRMAGKSGSSVQIPTPTASKPESLVLPNNMTEFAKVTSQMAELQARPDLKKALGSLLIGVNEKKLRVILEKLGYTKSDIDKIVSKIDNRLLIIPPGIYSYNIISNGDEILIVAVNNLNHSKYLLTNYFQKVNLVPDENGEFYHYAFEPYSVPPVVPYKLSIDEEIIHIAGTNYDRISSANIKAKAQLKYNTYLHSAGPKMPVRSTQKKQKIANANSEWNLMEKPPKSSKLRFHQGISGCSELTNQTDCVKNSKCEYFERKCRTKREHL